MDDDNLTKLESDIEIAAKNLVLASLSLKSCYVENASSVKSFVKLRLSVTNEAKVYSTKILPFSIKVIQNIQLYFENYDALTFEEFRDSIEDLAKEAEENKQVCEYTAELHTSLLTELVKSRDGADLVLKDLALETEALEKKMEKFQRKHKIASACAVSLAFIPYVNVVAAPVVGYIAHDADRDAIAAKTEKEIAVAVAKCIKESLMVSIGKFVEAITAIAGFFKVLANELELLNKNHQDDNPKNLHYKRAKKKSSTIIASCRLFISKIPSCKAELGSIPDDYDKNYVQEWLSKKQVEDQNGKSFIDWGLELFQYNKNMLKLLEA